MRQRQRPAGAARTKLPRTMLPDSKLPDSKLPDSKLPDSKLASRRPHLRKVTVAAAAVVAVVLAIVVLPAAPSLAVRLAAAVHTLGLKAHQASTAKPVGVPAAGAAVGALFTTSPGGLKDSGHFCTASVVNSPAGNVIMTAAHCVSGQNPSQFVFVPGYRNGKAPYGIWSVTRVIVDQAWASTASPEDDVAFLLVKKPGTTTSLQVLTGGEQLGFGQPAGQIVNVTGYPNNVASPISCLNRASFFSSTQLEFDCEGYSNGTSGSALLTHVDPRTGLGTAIGVIGGYQEGGDTNSVSYADRLGASVAAIYKVAAGRS
jgi:V8-like Glu-specific endopeptidase